MTIKRMSVPVMNRRKFDIETADYFDAIKCAGSPEEKKKLFENWKVRAGYLTVETRAHRVPARLIRQEGETAAEYLERIYERDWKCRTM